MSVTLDHATSRTTRPDQSPPPAPAAPAPERKRPRLYVVDGLRLLAALLVMSWHYAGLDLFPEVWGKKPEVYMPKLHTIGQFGWVGVEIFFVISGFVICMSCWGKSVGQFVSSRITRLFPAYWFCVLLTAAVLYTTKMPWTKDIVKGGYSNVLTNLTMVQSGVGEGDVDGVYWTLWVELRFYVLFGLLCIGGLTYRKVLSFCGLWAVAAVLANHVDSPFIKIALFPQYAPFFISGIAIYLMYRFGPNLLLWGLIGFSWLLGQHELWYITSGYFAYQGKMSHSVPLAMVTTGYLIMIGVALGVFDRIQWKWLSTAGALTYPLYLIHEQNGWWIIHELHTKVNAYVLVASLTVTMLCAAWLIHHLIERPLATRLNRGLKSALADIRRADRA